MRFFQLSKQVLIAFLLCTGFSACDIINPEEEIPAYIEILPYEYTVGEDGSTSTKITDGWIYVGGELLGAFELPKTVPVLLSGEVTVLLDAGVKENGINFTPTIYPFYARYSETVELVPGEVVTVQPTTRYDTDYVQMVFDEDFNDATIGFTEEVSKTLEEVREGSGSGFFELDKEDKPASEARSIALEKFPVEGNIAFLEIDYKSDVVIFVGIIGFDALGQETFSDLTYGLNPKEEWNKVYLNYSQLLNTLQQRNTQFYQIRVAAQIPIENGEFIMENAEIRLDNIKLITS